MQRKHIVLAICLLMTLLAVDIVAQTNMVRYTNDFRFRDGFYLNFEQVRNNSPIPQSRILTSIDPRSNRFFEEVTQLRTITYFDDLGNSQEVATAQLWGYSRNGILHININGTFNRITIVGSISHFVANITTVHNRFYDPRFSPHGFHSPYGWGSPHGFHSPHWGSRNAVRTTELRQFLLDFNTGRVMEYNPNNVRMLLMSDPELHDEFSSLRNRRRQQLQFSFIRRFNERYPLYLPR